ncbi:type I-E CRISPR-associated protein Cas7/Cse4/CasC [Thiothrix lacustris]|uniref:Type I-E CRISPR-associated protein Cas7/Cse4/CasC n=1 Tax=Thiothrix lacustris TaxID=525917 RepID=A0ABY9MSK4_9GAMM|nr:type I-E CRISPR-associated protein Cas7/Cse4/CasC [Thiothrix lacustris]WML91155.1 type I-E CRISPR-associated protein Cas7/Cse4/CasC [Thiothrix lacustris]
MSRFVQLHLLTSYPPANLNRDDLGRPKTAMMGGEPRLRVSSQSLKRAWRTSEVFAEGLKGHIGTRTKEMGLEIFKQLREKGIAKKEAMDWTKLIAEQFGKLKKANKDNELQELEIEQLAHFSPEERQGIDTLVAALAERKSKPEESELTLLRKKHTAADIALFGRMLASSPAFNTEAAAQVAHAISVHSIVVEDDFFTAVDDLNNGEDDSGASHLGETEFAAGLFYLYLCIDKDLLVKNLSGDEALANKTLEALIESTATVSPSGKQNSFASRARASYILCETGKQQPRSLSVAYLKPVRGGDMLISAIKQLETTLESMDKVYGACADKRCSMNAVAVEGSLQAIIQCATEA